MATALRIIPEYYSGGSAWASAVDFDEEEYRNCLVSFAQTNYVQESQVQAPNIYDAGKAHSYDGTDKYILTVEIFYRWSTTEAKGLGLFDYSMRYKVYHRFLESASTYRTYVLDPNYDIIYAYGEKLQRSIILKFYETYLSL